MMFVITLCYFIFFFLLVQGLEKVIIWVTELCENKAKGTEDEEFMAKELGMSLDPKTCKAITHPCTCTNNDPDVCRVHNNQ